jgi:hypothetical protein
MKVTFDQNLLSGNCSNSALVGPTPQFLPNASATKILPQYGSAIIIAAPLAGVSGNWNNSIWTGPSPQSCIEGKMQYSLNLPLYHHSELLIVALLCTNTDVAPPLARFLSSNSPQISSATSTCCFVRTSRRLYHRNLANQIFADLVASLTYVGQMAGDSVRY